MAGRDGLRYGDVLLSFQRFARPENGILSSPPGAPRAPRSLGALPVGSGGRLFYLPLEREEAFWIGVLPGAGAISRAILTLLCSDALGHIAAIGRVRPGMGATFPGRPLRDGNFAALSPPVCSRLFARMRDLDGTSTVRVDIVRPAEFTAATGQPPPSLIDPDAGYKGWRLP